MDRKTLTYIFVSIITLLGKSLKQDFVNVNIEKRLNKKEKKEENKLPELFRVQNLLTFRLSEAVDVTLSEFVVVSCSSMILAVLEWWVTRLAAVIYLLVSCQNKENIRMGHSRGKVDNFSFPVNQIFINHAHRSCVLSLVGRTYRNARKSRSTDGMQIPGTRQIRRG